MENDNKPISSHNPAIPKNFSMPNSAVMQQPIPPTIPQPPIVEQSSNPLLAKVQLPGETWQLPSKGLFYTNGELSPNVKEGEVHVYPMTAVDELVIRSSDRLFGGTGINDVFLRCVPDILKPEELLAKDVDFLLGCLRKVSYGPMMDMSQTHDCDGAKEHDYQINIQAMLQQAKQIDPTVYEAQFMTTMPNGVVVKFKPSTFAMVIEVLQDAIKEHDDDVPEIELAKKILTDTLGSAILQVDDITDRDMIVEWALQLPAVWLKENMKPIIDKINDFGVTFSEDVICKDCEKKMKIEIAINPTSFFS